MFSKIPLIIFLVISFSFSGVCPPSTPTSINPVFAKTKAIQVFYDSDNKRTVATVTIVKGTYSGLNFVPGSASTDTVNLSLMLECPACQPVGFEPAYPMGVIRYAFENNKILEYTYSDNETWWIPGTGNKAACYPKVLKVGTGK
jgi:hypothetical protein